MSWYDDTQFTEETITGVNSASLDDGEEGWMLEFAGAGIYCPGTTCTVRPQIGEAARLYGKGFGYAVRGIVVEGRVYRYLTEEQEVEERENLRLAQEEKRQRELDETRAERDRRIAALPEGFQARIHRFQRAMPHWRRDHESYELFVCEEGVKIARYLVQMTLEEKTLKVLGSAEDIIRTFCESTEMQKAAGVSDEHSGNTFSAAVRLALRSMTVSQEPLVRDHGALCALVGCKLYGCFAAYPEA
jgi:hypothetical protein